MYNEERKRVFIQSCTDSERVRADRQALFEKLAPFERRWGMDIAQQQDLQAVKEAIGSVVSAKNGSFAVDIRFLRAYVSWCASNGYPATDTILQLDTVNIGGILRQMVFSPAHLSSVMDLIFDPADSCSTDIVLRAALWLAYMGVPAEHLYELQKRHVHFNHGELRLRGIVYPLYTESVRTFDLCCSAVQFRNESYRDGELFYTRVMTRDPGTWLLRGTAFSNTATEEKAVRSLRSALSTKIKTARKLYPDKPALDITYERVATSGVCYRLFQTEVAGRTINFVREAERVLIYRGYTQEEIDGNHSLLMASVRSMRKDYAAWKQALLTNLT